MFSRRHPKTSKTVLWSTHQTMRQEFMKLLDREGSSESFGANYVQDVAVRREVLERRQVKLQLFNVALLVMLCMHLVAGVKEFSFIGISSKDIANLKELLVAISATTTILIGVFSYAINETKVIIRAWLDKNYDDKYEREFAGLRLSGMIGETAGLWHLPTDDPRFPWPISYWFIGGGAIFSAVIFFSAALAVPVVHGFVVWDIFQSSVLPYPWPILLLCYVISANFTYLFFSLVPALPLPHTDYTLTKELSRIKEEEGEEAYKQRLQEIFEEWKEKKQR